MKHHYVPPDRMKQVQPVSEADLLEAKNHTHPNPIPDAATTYLTSTSIFTPTIQLKITSTNSPSYLPSLLLLSTTIQNLDKAHANFFKDPNTIHLDIPNWMYRIGVINKELSKIYDRFADLGAGKRVFGAWEAVDALIGVVDNVLGVGGEFTEWRDFREDHRVLKRMYEKGIQRALEKAKSGLEVDLKAAGWEDTA